MSGHRRRERRTFFDVLAHLQQNLLKVFVVLLLGQDLETLNERETGVDHHRKLPREHRQVLRLYFLAAADLGNSDFASLFFDGRQRHLFAAQDLSQGFAIVGNAFADDDFVQSVASFKDVGWHGSELPQWLLSYVWSLTNRPGLSIRTRVRFRRAGV